MKGAQQPQAECHTQRHERCAVHRWPRCGTIPVGAMHAEGSGHVIDLVSTAKVVYDAVCNGVCSAEKE